MKNKIESLGIYFKEAEELIKVSKDIEKDYKKLRKGYPIQYLIGYSNFYGNKIYINKNVLIPRFETEFLVEKTIKYIKKYLNEEIKIIDLGTGSGCIAVSLSKSLPKSRVDAVDVDCKCLKVAKKNNKENNTNVNFFRHDILKPLKNKYDVIISNPPYVSYDEKIDYSVKKHEPHKALFAKNDGIEFYKKIIKNSKEFLNSKNIIAFEIGKNQGKTIKKIVSDFYPKAKVIIEQDYNKRDRYLFIFNNLE